MYSQFGHPIQIRLSEFPDWISQSRSKLIISSDRCVSTMSSNLPLHVSHNYLGMILCVGSLPCLTSNFLVKTTTSNFIWSGKFETYGGEYMMVIVPISTFTVEDGDDSIYLEADGYVQLYGIHLLYKSHLLRSKSL